jgi:hypothetical protein
MKNKLIELSAVCTALFLVFALSGCPQSHDDLLTLEEALGGSSGGYIIQAEDGTPHGDKITKDGTKGEGTIGTCMNELQEADGSEHYFTLDLPPEVANGSYIVKFRYASGMDTFGINFTVVNISSEVVYTTGVVGMSDTESEGHNDGWNLTNVFNYADSTVPVQLKAYDTLKIWSMTHGCIDFIKLEQVD